MYGIVGNLWNSRGNVWNSRSTLYTGNHNKHYQYKIMNEPILSTEIERDLGILLRADLKSSCHVTLIVQRAERCLAVLKRNIVSRDRKPGKVFVKLYKQLVRPHLEYAACLWNPSLKIDIKFIERVQHRATKCITGLQSKSYTN